MTVCGKVAGCGGVRRAPQLQKRGSGQPRVQAHGLALWNLACGGQVGLSKCVSFQSAR